MRYVLPFVALGVAGCLTEVGGERVAEEAEGDFALSFLASLDAQEAALYADSEGGPHPFVLMRFLEAGDVVPDGIEFRETWEEGTSVAQTPDGRQLFLLIDDVPYAQFLIGGDVPEGARAFIVLGVPGLHEDAVAIVREGAAEAELLSWSSNEEPWRLPIVRGPDGVQGAPGLSETVALRWLRTCPGLLEQCVVYGAPEDVAETKDPIEPAGRWFLHPRNARLRAPEGARFAHVARYDAEGAALIVEASAIDDPYEVDGPRSFYRAWLEAGGRRVHAFDWIGQTDTDGVLAGIARDGERLIAWYWRSFELAASISEHDAGTLAPTREPVTLEAEMYFDPECTYGIFDTRPIPVRVGDELAFALWWGGPDVLLFDGVSSYGSEAQVDVPAAEYPDVGMTSAPDAPAVLRLAR